MDKQSLRATSRGTIRCLLSLTLYLMLGQCVTHAQPVLKVDITQNRLSSFIDGSLIDDERAFVRHPNQPPKAQALFGARVEWSPQKWTDWAVGGFVERELWADGAPGSVEALAFANSDRKADRDFAYPLQFNYQLTRRWGISARKHWRLGSSASSPRIWLGGKGFLVDEFRSIRTDGVLTESVAGNVGFRAEVKERELGDATTFVSPKKSLGIGLGFDLGAEWGDPEGLSWRFDLKDIGPPVKLSNVLGTLTNYNTNDASRDEQGRIVYNPMISGLYSDESASVQFKPKWSLAGKWQKSAWLALKSEIGHSTPYTQASLGLEVGPVNNAFLSGIHVGTGGLPTSMSLGWRHKSLELSWRGDSSSPNKARVWMLNGSIRL